MIFVGVSQYIEGEVLELGSCVEQGNNNKTAAFTEAA
jgi:hypothetical protein